MISAPYLGVCERIFDGSFVPYTSGRVGTTACARPAIPSSDPAPVSKPAHQLREEVSWAGLTKEEQDSRILLRSGKARKRSHH